MSLFPRRIAFVFLAAALAGGSTLGGVAIARNGAARERTTLESRIAALEAGSNARLEGLGNELSGLRKAVDSDGRTVKVTGEAYLPSTLNAVIVAFQIRAPRKTVGTAMAAASSLADKVTAELKQAGVTSDNVRTVWDGAYPNYEREGFAAQARVLATVRHLTNIDRVSKAALSVGKEVSIAYVNVSDESGTSALAEARQEALKEARAKAQRYATAAGRKLGALTSLSEQVSPETAPSTPGDGEYAYRPAFIVVVDATFELI